MKTHASFLVLPALVFFQLATPLARAGSGPQARKADYHAEMEKLDLLRDMSSQTDEDIRKILGGNVLRVLADVEAVAAQP